MPEQSIAALWTELGAFLLLDFYWMQLRQGHFGWSQCKIKLQSKENKDAGNYGNTF